MVIDWMTPVGLVDISTVWGNLQCSVREKEWAKFHPEEVGTETAHPWACTACPGPAGLQVRRCTLNTRSIRIMPWFFNTHGPNPCSWTSATLVWADLALNVTHWLWLTHHSFSQLFSAGFEIISFSSSVPDTPPTYRPFLEVASRGPGILAEPGSGWSLLSQRPGSESWACGGTKLPSGRNSSVE